VDHGDVMAPDVLQERLHCITHNIEQGEHRARAQQACVDRLTRADQDTEAAAEALRLTHEALDCLYICRALIQDELGLNDPRAHRWGKRSEPVY
jgi:hypothetical protein